jgi:hypothetical protein
VVPLPEFEVHGGAELPREGVEQVRPDLERIKKPDLPACRAKPVVKVEAALHFIDALLPRSGAEDGVEVVTGSSTPSRENVVELVAQCAADGKEPVDS